MKRSGMRRTVVWCRVQLLAICKSGRTTPSVGQPGAAFAVRIGEPHSGEPLPCTALARATLFAMPMLSACLLSVVLAVPLDAQDARVPLTPGRHAYRLQQTNALKISMLSGDNTPTIRDLFFSLEVSDVDNGRHLVEMRIDSVAMTPPNGSRALHPEFRGAGWKGTLDHNGRQLTHALVMPDGRETDDMLVTPLAWILPMFTAGQTDTLSFQIASIQGPAHTIAAVRSFSLEGNHTITAAGTVSRAPVTTVTSGGRPVQITSTGTYEGRWERTTTGAIDAAKVVLRIHDVFVVGTTEVSRDELSNLTLTRLGR